MKRFIVLLFLLSRASSSVAHGQLTPVVGTPLEILYRPSTTHPLATAEKLEIVYAFNYWGTRMGTRLALLENVLRPDSGQSYRTPMIKTGQGWTARIEIPEKAAVLSYYITDGAARDDNNEKTYAFYVYGPDGKPVRNARYFMTMFLGLARADLDARLKEAEAEIRAYPENFRAWPLYFSLRFELGKGSVLAREQIEEELTGLVKRHENNEECLNLAARTYYYILRDVKTALELKERISLTAQWPEVLLIHDREKAEEESRRRNMERMQTRAALIGARVPSVAWLDTSRERRSFSEEEGRVVLVVFWASVSDQSRVALDRLSALHGRIGSENFRIIGINVDADETAARRYMEEHRLPVIFGFAQGSIVQEFGVDGIPQLYLIDKTGIIRVGHTGLTPENLTSLESAAKVLLSEQ